MNASAIWFLLKAKQTGKRGSIVILDVNYQYPSFTSFMVSTAESALLLVSLCLFYIFAMWKTSIFKVITVVIISKGFASVLCLIERKTIILFELRKLQLLQASRAELKNHFENLCVLSQSILTQFVNQG